MYGGPLLSILTSPKKASSSSSSSDQKEAFSLSVDDLLDNPWHYDCVVSPRLSSSIFDVSNNSTNKSSISAPPPSWVAKPAASPSSSSPSPSKPANPSSSSLSKPSSTQPCSTYVSLASFINNSDKSSYGSSAAAGLDNFSRKRSKPITPILSKCREREPKSNARGDPSQIRSYADCLAVD